MRIGILTLPLHTNYGGILQAYALQTVLERMGHEAYLIEKIRKPLKMPLWKAPLSYSKRILKKMMGYQSIIFFEQKINRETPIVRQNTDKFINDNIKRIIIDGYFDIKENDFSAIIVGSDQIWRPKYFSEIEHAYLDFTQNWNILRISYAASFGTDEWEYNEEQTKQCGKLIKTFNAVSVREKSGIDLCRQHFGTNAEHVLDPTMLLAKEDYIRLFDTMNLPKSDGNLFCYVLDNSSEKSELIEKVAKERCLRPFYINKDFYNFEIEVNKRIQPPVEAWIRGLYDAELVITDSFHACVFSILFNKPFIAICNADRGLSRFISLFNMFGLGQKEQISNSAIIDCTETDWDSLNNTLNEKIRFSLKILKESLN